MQTILIGGTAYAHFMCLVVDGLTQEQVRDVARYCASRGVMEAHSSSG